MQNPLNPQTPFRPTPRNERQEMILLTLARAEENTHRLTLPQLSNELNSEVTPHLRLLIEQALVQVDPAGMLALTQAGRDRARVLLRRHRLTERLFTDMLDLDWARAHEEADKFEHVLSPAAEAQIASALGNPDTCPHGNPIPGAAEHSTPLHAIALIDCSINQPVTITRIASETPAALQHLATLGLLPNVPIIVENKAPFDGPVLIRVGRAHYALGHNLAARIWVRPTSKLES